MAAYSSEGGGSQLYFGEVVTLWGLCSRLFRTSPGPSPRRLALAPLPVPARPRRTWSDDEVRRARTR